MAAKSNANGMQAEYWNAAPGLKWIEFESYLDAAMAGMLDCLLEAARPRKGQKVLDIGCGTGASSIAAAKRVGASGQVDSVDISPALLDRARMRANGENIDNIRFMICDAQSFAFPENEYDCVLSRHGMMFFDQPAAALANIARALRPGGAMSFVTWASGAKNPWFSIPKNLAIARLGTPSPTDPLAPGPLAFQDIGYVTAMLENVGLQDISGHEISTDFTPPGDPAHVAAVTSHVGPSARIIKEFDRTVADAKAIERGVAAAFSEFYDGQQMRIPARINLFTARRG